MVDLTLGVGASARRGRLASKGRADAGDGEYPGGHQLQVRRQAVRCRRLIHTDGGGCRFRPKKITGGEQCRQCRAGQHGRDQFPVAPHRAEQLARTTAGPCMFASEP